MPTVNVDDVALIFEGGGMRGALTSAVVAQLVEAGIVFPFVAGISAGSTNTINYLSGDAWRARASFTTFVTDPNFGDWRTFVRGKGLFNSEYIYRRTAEPGQALPLDFEALHAHPAAMSISALRCRDGVEVRWGKGDVPTLPDLVARVQASSTMPVIMPPVEIDGEWYIDGALGTSGGIALDAAREAGYQRFFVVLTQPRGYVKMPTRNPWFFKQYYRRYPAAAQALLTRPRRYNATRAELFELERQGSAYLFAPERMPVGNGERKLPALEAAYSLGADQSRRELPAWRGFLGLS